jgi:hypothetical protein
VDIQQEYWQRAGIKQPPLRYPECEHIVLRRRREGGEQPRYVIATVAFHQRGNEQRPVQPSLTEYHPIRGSTGNTPLHPKKPRVADWGEEWEKMLVAWVKELADSYEPVPDDDLDEAAWEIFVFTNEGWLGNYLDDARLDQLHASLFGPDADGRAKARGLLSAHFRRYDGSSSGRSVSSSLQTISTYAGKKTYAGWLADAFRYAASGGVWH